eukprot:6202171-Pleurochrysis_carterae.AAC.1
MRPLRFSTDGIVDGRRKRRKAAHTRARFEGIPKRRTQLIARTRPGARSQARLERMRSGCGLTKCRPVPPRRPRRRRRDTLRSP